MAEKYKRIQFRISESDEVLSGLVTKLEEEAQGRKGYVANKIKDMIRAFHIISEQVGESDPHKIMMKIGSMQNGTVLPEKEPEESNISSEDPNIRKGKKPKKKVNSAAMMSSFGNMGKL